MGKVEFKYSLIFYYLLAQSAFAGGQALPAPDSNWLEQFLEPQSLEALAALVPKDANSFHDRMDAHQNITQFLTENKLPTRGSRVKKPLAPLASTFHIIRGLDGKVLQITKKEEGPPILFCFNDSRAVKRNATDARLSFNLATGERIIVIFDVSGFSSGSLGPPEARVSKVMDGAGNILYSRAETEKERDVLAQKRALEFEIRECRRHSEEALQLIERAVEELATADQLPRFRPGTALSEEENKIVDYQRKREEKLFADLQKMGVFSPQKILVEPTDFDTSQEKRASISLIQNLEPQPTARISLGFGGGYSSYFDFQLPPHELSLLEKAKRAIPKLKKLVGIAEKPEPDWTKLQLLHDKNDPYVLRDEDGQHFGCTRKALDLLISRSTNLGAQGTRSESATGATSAASLQESPN